MPLLLASLAQAHALPFHLIIWFMLQFVGGCTMLLMAFARSVKFSFTSLASAVVPFWKVLVTVVCA